jgi:hypothetical protein
MFADTESVSLRSDTAEAPAARRAVPQEERPPGRETARARGAAAAFTPAPGALGALLLMDHALVE